MGEWLKTLILNSMYLSFYACGVLSRTGIQIDEHLWRDNVLLDVLFMSTPCVGTVLPSEVFRANTSSRHCSPLAYYPLLLTNINQCK